jgi:hypothetical protein
MSKLTINWGEVKSIASGAKLFEGSFIDESGTETTATIWEKDKEGKVFPDFATLAPGHIIEGNLWQSPTTKKWTVYPPKPEAAKGGNRTAMMEKVMDKKAGQIENFQAKKESSIEKMACQRDAVLLVTAFYPELATVAIVMREESIARKIEHWREYLQNKLNQPF